MFGELTHYGRPVAHNARLTYSKYVPIREAAITPSEVRSFVQAEARQALADQIARTRMQSIEHDHHIEFRCDVYVFSPDEFWEIVDQAANELARRFTPTPVTP